MLLLLFCKIYGELNKLDNEEYKIIFYFNRYVIT